MDKHGLAPSGGRDREFRGLRLVGGHPALDFLNTVKFRGRSEPEDKLGAFADVVAWAEIAGLIDSEEAMVCAAFVAAKADAAHRAFMDIVQLREAFRNVLIPLGQGDQTRAHASEALLTDRLAKLAGRARIDRHTASLDLFVPIRIPIDLSDRLVLAIKDLLERDSGQRVRSCDGHDCDWVFLDGGRGRARRWCDSRTCGNAARVRVHRARKTSPNP